MAASGRRRGLITDINVTPLVDIMLVLLIIFMLTAHLIARQVIEVQLPKAAQASSANPTTLAVTLTREGRMFSMERQPRRRFCARRSRLLWPRIPRPR